MLLVGGFRMQWPGVFQKTSFVHTLALCVLVSSISDKGGRANTFSVTEQRPYSCNGLRFGRHATDFAFQDRVIVKILALRGGGSEAGETEDGTGPLAVRSHLESEEAQAAKKFIEGGEIVPFSFLGRPQHPPKQHKSKQRSPLTKKRSLPDHRRISRPGTLSNPVTGLDTYGVSHVVPPPFSSSGDSSHRGGMHPLRALAGAPLSEVGGTWGAWEKAAWVVVKQGVWWLLKAVGAVCEKLAVLEGKYEEIVAERERLAALERGSALPAPPPHCKPLKLSAAHVHSADETLSGYCDSPLDSRPLAYAEGMRRLAYGKGYRRRSPMLFPAKPKDDAAKVIDDNGRDGMGHAWLLADGKPGDFVVDLGGFADVLAVTVRNTRNGRARDRGTKDFHIEASSDMLEWRPLVRGSLRDQRAHPLPPLCSRQLVRKGGRLAQLSFLYALSRSFTPLIWLAYKADAVFNEGWEALLR